MDSLTLPWPVVLGSASPRRREILARIIREFEVDAPDLDEDALTLDDPWQTARELARAKADAIFSRHPNKLVVAGDTVVAVPLGDGFQQLAKPADRADALRMLGILQGREHLVITAICVRWPEGERLFEVTTGVTFHPLDAGQIEAYVDAGESMDKAGAYAAQGKAAEIIASIDGSMTNVIGLPEEELRTVLEGFAR